MKKSEKSKSAKALVESTGLTTVEICYKLGISPSTLFLWKKGAVVPRILVTDIPLYLEVFGCSVEELVAAFENTKKLDSKKKPKPALTAQ